jgi:hypothetical protein
VGGEEGRGKEVGEKGEWGKWVRGEEGNWERTNKVGIQRLCLLLRTFWRVFVCGEVVRWVM